MIAAMIALKRSETELLGDVFFVGLSDEEEQGRGVEYLLEYGLLRRRHHGRADRHEDRHRPQRSGVD